MVGASGWGQGSGELLFNEHSTSVGEDKNSGGGWWRCLQNKMNVHIVTERMVETVNFTVCMFSHNNRNWRRKRQALQVNSFSALTLVPEISGDCLPLCHWGQGTAPTPQSQRLHGSLLPWLWWTAQSELSKQGTPLIPIIPHHRITNFTALRQGCRSPQRPLPHLQKLADYSAPSRLSSPF